jgi:uncharacterized protein YqfA (UPF0365 family)
MLPEHLMLPLLADPDGWSWWTIVLLFVAVVVFLVVIGFVFKYFGLWIQCYASRASIGIIDLIGMTLRKVRPEIIVQAKIAALKAGIEGIENPRMEAHYLARGNVINVIYALIAADRARLPLNFDRACAIDLAGRDVREAVAVSVNPKVIDCPDTASGKRTIDAVAKDGIQLRCKARVTVRASLERLVGGATEETIIARVGEGIVTAIGSADTYTQVLENPDLISKAVLAKGLDAGTAFEILSIDIADIDVGENIGARLQADQAEADKRVAQAYAEKRRSLAVALEQENVAKIRENRALVVLAEAEVPKAVAEAFRGGNLGILDYLRIKNIQADTSMRDSIAGEADHSAQDDVQP